jgi:xylan 1,4-beta-xylosidase
MIPNPILPGFHPDPSLLYVDGIFYIANSTFEYYPGVKISASKDLANWETVCYPLGEKRLLDMEGNPSGCGIWAPCLTHDGGKFYLVYTDVKSWNAGAYKDTPNYIVTADSITGPWSDPVFVNCSGFDPSLFHDSDGRKYLVSMEWDYRKRDSAQFSGILLTELDPVRLTPIREPMKIYTGSARGLTEGPHLYKVGEFYYLFVAEGGTEYDHAETVARSRNLAGPYETHPQTHLVSAMQSPDAYLQKTGHGSLAQAADGRWWFACLCGRPLPGTRRCPLGRETAINEILWEDGWPYLKNQSILMDLAFEGYGEPRKPEPIEYHFKDNRFWADFQSLRSPAKFTVLDTGALRLYGGASPVCNFGQNMLVRRQTDFQFTATTSLKLTGENFQQMAGLLYRYDERNHYFWRVARNDEGNAQVLGLLVNDRGALHMPLDGQEIRVEADRVFLRLTVTGPTGRFSYSFDGQAFRDIDYSADVSKLSDEYDTQGFTGAFVGMGCVDMRDRTAYADFYGFSYEPNP